MTDFAILDKVVLSTATEVSLDTRRANILPMTPEEVLRHWASDRDALAAARLIIIANYRRAIQQQDGAFRSRGLRVLGPRWPRKR